MTVEFLSTWLRGTTATPPYAKNASARSTTASGCSSGRKWREPPTPCTRRSSAYGRDASATAPPPAATAPPPPPPPGGARRRPAPLPGPRPHPPPGAEGGGTPSG